MTKPYSVLVVDDVEANRDLLSRRVSREGCLVEKIASGQDALTLSLLLAEPERFDLVLLDVMMPGMTGYEVLQWMKSEGVLRHIPVIAASALTEPESAIKCIELVAQDYLPKPIDPVLFEHAWRQHLSESVCMIRCVLTLRVSRKRSVEPMIFLGHGHSSVLSGSLALLAAAAVAASIRENRLMQQIAELREINEANANQQVAELTDTEYFWTLQGQAGAFRQRSQKDKS